jgi:hypothetical protein
MMLVLLQYYRKPAVVIGCFADPLEAELMREVLAQAERKAMVWRLAAG